jgi:hypothetical protein
MEKVMKRLLIAAACGAFLSLGCETQPSNQPAARTANKPPITEQPRTDPGESVPAAANRTDEATPAPGGPGAANPQPDAPATK